MPFSPTFTAPASRRRHWALVLFAMLLLAAAVLVLALFTGSIAVTPAELWAGWRHGDDGDAAAAFAILRDLRLPRALAAFACGGLLALSGAMMQLLLRNPLADPYVLGVSGGAAAGALLSWLLLMPWLQTPLAVAGALLSTALVWFGAGGRANGFDERADDAAWSGALPRLLLTGVVIAAGWGALIVLMLSLAPDAQLRSALAWLMGDLSGAPMPWPALAVLALALALIWPQARHLNQLAFGSRHAEALGVPLRRTRAWLYVLAAVTAATAVVTAGCLAFVGLIVPHALRLLLGNDQRLLLPACVLGGGAFLTVADTAARTLTAPQVLPTGVFTALIGVPAFLYLLRRV